MNQSIARKTRKTVSLKTLSEMYDIKLWTLRKMASQRAFPGIIKMGRRIYVVLEVFDAWFMSHELKDQIEDHVIDGTAGTPKFKFLNNLIGGFYQ